MAVWERNFLRFTRTSAGKDKDERTLEKVSAVE
jgi:hypothetical protein